MSDASMITAIMTEPAARFRWFEMVMSHPKITAAAIPTAWHLSDLYNLKKGVAWPSYETLAVRINRTRTTAINSVKLLVSLGFIEIVSHGGRRGSNHYRPCYELASPSRDIVNSTQQGGQADLTAVVNLAGRYPSYDPDHKGRGSKKGTSLGVADAALGAPPPPHPAPSAADADDKMEAGFEAFWREYPKKENRRRAYLAFCRVVASGEASIEVLVDGAARYAAAMKETCKEDRWIKHPANWLAEEYWLETWEVKAPKPVRKGQVVQVSADKPNRPRPQVKRPPATSQHSASKPSVKAQPVDRVSAKASNTKASKRRKTPLSKPGRTAYMPTFAVGDLVSARRGPHGAGVVLDIVEAGVVVSFCHHRLIVEPSNLNPVERDPERERYGAFIKATRERHGLDRKELASLVPSLCERDLYGFELGAKLLPQAMRGKLEAALADKPAVLAVTQDQAAKPAPAAAIKITAGPLGPEF